MGCIFIALKEVFSKTFICTTHTSLSWSMETRSASVFFAGAVCFSFLAITRSCSCFCSATMYWSGLTTWTGDSSGEECVKTENEKSGTADQWLFPVTIETLPTETNADMYSIIKWVAHHLFIHYFFVWRDCFNWRSTFLKNEFCHFIFLQWLIGNEGRLVKTTGRFQSRDKRSY